MSALAGAAGFAQRARHRDPDSEFDVSWRADESGLLELRARASYLRAEALLPLAGLVPQRDIRERLRDMAPIARSNAPFSVFADTSRDPR